MVKLKNTKSIILIILLFLTTNCSKNSGMKPEDFENKEPRLIIENYLSGNVKACLLYTSPSPRDRTRSRMPCSA